MLPKYLNQLRSFASSGDTNGFAELIRPLLENDFRQCLRTLKEQKLVSHLRSVARIRELRGLLSARSSPLSVDESERSELEHHFSVCEFFQELFTRLDKETLALSAAAAHPENVCRAVAGMVEIVNYAVQRRAVPSIDCPPRVQTMLQLANYDRMLREVLDEGNIILNSDAAKRGSDKTRKIERSDLNALIRLATLYREMLSCFDMYTYQNAEIRINRRSLVVSSKEHDADIAAVVGAERTANHDHTRQSILAPLELSLRGECDSIPIGTSRAFVRFLVDVGRSRAAVLARHVGLAIAKDLEIEVGDFFDITTEVSTKSGTFTVADLIRAWAFLVTIAILGQVWNERLADIGPDNETSTRTGRAQTTVIRQVPVPEIPRPMLVRLVSRELQVLRVKARGLIEQFTSVVATGRLDLFYKPLLLLPGETILLPTPYIRGSRFERNIFMLVVTETELDQKQKGYLPIPELRKALLRAGFKSLINFRVKIKHRELTDIDLVAYKDGILFLGQCKIVIEPDGAYDTWKAEGKLEFAARQLDTCVSNFDSIRASVFERLGLGGCKEQRIVPFILTNTRLFTERCFRGYPVVDITYLQFLLGGAKPAVISLVAGELEFSSSKPYIAGTTPTGEELANLLVRTIHKVHERKVTRRHAMRKVGNLRVHMPVLAVQSYGDGGYFFGRDSVSEEDAPMQPWLRADGDVE